ncbi:MAG: exo-alpha-sialidase [Chromatiales bacterium]|jgi:predicted neuraminidase
MRPTRSLLFRRWNSRLASAIKSTSAERAPTHPAIVERGFVVPEHRFGMCHASTIAHSGDALIAAWFAGSLEGRADVAIWLARNAGSGWSDPVRVASGEQSDGSALPCWNPVLFEPAQGPLMLFYKLGPGPRSWWGLLKTSDDHGATWSEPRRLPDGILGPIKNKPIELGDGTIVSPSSTEDGPWRVHIELSIDHGASWTRLGPVDDGQRITAIQPSLLQHRDGRLQLLCRSKQGRIAESWSADGGQSWGPLELTGLPNPNSGTDAVTLADGRQLLVYNDSERARSPLSVAISTDGETWNTVLTLERGLGEYSYPAVIQTGDGRVHITYSWNLRCIAHAVLDPGWLSPTAGDCTRIPFSEV